LAQSAHASPVHVEENPRLCGWGAEIVSIVADEAFYDLDGPPVRITTPHIRCRPPTFWRHRAANVERIVDRVHRRCREWVLRRLSSPRKRVPSIPEADV